MSNLGWYSFYAETALTAYAVNLVSGSFNNVDRYRDPDVGMTRTQAQTFDATWAVLQQSSPAINGFSAVLLQRKNEVGNAVGEKVLAIAGTDGWADLITDVMNIAAYGTVLGMPQYLSLESFYAELVTSGKLGASEKITMTGHSLGGFLAQAFTVRHSTVVSATYTYNAPGFGTLEVMLGFFGVTDTTGAAAKITNVHATDGISMTAGRGVMVGAWQPVRIETDANPLNNHSIVKLGDALAIYDTYAKLQPNISMEQASALFVASGEGDRRQEDALDALRTVFIGSSSNDVNKTPTGSRDVFYSNLYQLQSNAVFKTLSGQVRLLPVTAEFVSSARAASDTAMAYRYALLELLPFAAVATTDVQNQTLYGHYTQRLSLYDQSTGQGELTQGWINDRATLLAAITACNIKDGNSLAYDAAFPTDRAFDLHWVDANGTEQILVAENTARHGGVLKPVALQRFAFGGEGSDTLVGSDINKLGDHLYGGAGDDVLNGWGGDDYLEGGSGTDTYQFSGHFGEDTILDSDGLGKIQLGVSLILSGGKETSTGSGLWISADGQYRYTLRTEPDNTTTLTIHTPAGADRILVKNFQNHWLGIDLDGAVVTPPATTNLDIVGDLAARDMAPTEAGLQIGYDLLGNVLTDPDTPEVGRVDTLYDGTGNDHLTSGAGDDSVLANRGGDDWIETGAGRDYAYGAVGQDVIEGGTGGDILDGGAGDDRIYADAQVSVATAMARGNTAANFDTQGDWLAGGAGDDTLVGSDARDVLAGGVGADLLIGGAGDDDILGDMDWVAQGFNWTVVDLADGTRYFFPVDEYPATDGGADVIHAGNGNDHAWGGIGDDAVFGEAGDDKLYGEEGNDILFGGAGLDFISGGTGHDYLDGGTGRDQLTGGEGDDALFGGTGFDFLFGDSVDGSGAQGSDTLDGQDGDDYLEGGGNDDVLHGGAGRDILWGDTSATNAARLANSALFWGNDYLDGEDGDDLLFGGGRDDTLHGGAGNDSLWGDEGNAALAGEFNGNDYLDGEDGNDQLIGGGKDDTLYGGTGDDMLMGDDDLAKLVAQFHGSDYLDGEAGDDKLYGGGGDDILLGAAGDDLLDGGTGADSMRGGSGNDSYFVDDAGDVVVEAFGEGLDSVVSSIDIALPDNVENLTLTGSIRIDASGNTSDNVLTGSAGANRLVGLAGNDRLDGGAGADTLIGGLGDDTYEVDNTGDSVIELLDEGADIVHTTVSFTLGANLERLVALGAGNLFLAGNTLDNDLLGNTGSNLLTGGAGNDYLVGGSGDDVYVFNRTDGQDFIDNTDFLRDSANSALAGATDTLSFGAGIRDTDVLGWRGGEDLVLTIKGTSDQITVAGYYAAETVDGTRVSDRKIDRVEFFNGVVWSQATIATMVARAANNHAPVVAGVVPSMTARADTSFTYTVPLGTIQDADAGDTLVYSVRMLDGSALPSWLAFDAGTRTLSGTPGATNTGALQFVFWAADSYGLQAGAGVNLTVYQANRAPLVTTPLPDKTASLSTNFAYQIDIGAFGDADAGDSLRFSATLADGSSLPQWMRFDPASRTLSGLPTSVGAIDLRITATDTGNLSVSDVLTITVVDPSAGVVLVGTAGNDVLTGTAGNDTLSGLAGDDTLDGKTGNNSLNGGDGDDILTVALFSKNNVLEGGKGTDLITGSGGYDSYRFNLGDGRDTVIEASAGDGADGSDELVFGAGISAADIEVTRSGADLLLRHKNGSDQITIGGWFARTPTFSVTAKQIETIRFVDNTVWTSLTLTAAALVVSGTAGADYMTDSDMDDTLYGLGGNDQLIGNQGHNILYGGDGDDNLYALNGYYNVTYYYSNGSASSTGYWGRNEMYGGAGDDILSVQRGTRDTVFEGGSGNDTIHGSGYNDTYRFNPGDGHDTISEYLQVAGFDDKIVFGAGILPADIRLARVGDDMVFNHRNGTDRITVVNWFMGTDLRIETVEFADLTVWGAVKIAALLDAPPLLLTPLPNQSVNEDSAWSFVMPADTFSDAGMAGAATLSYSAKRADDSALPAWMSFNAATHTFSGTPLNANVGNLSLKIIATNAAGKSVSTLFALSVVNTNDAPVLVRAPVTQLATEMRAFIYTVPEGTFADVDAGDGLTLSAALASGAALPDWLVFAPATRELQGTPSISDAAVLDIQITASDRSGASATTSFKLDVANIVRGTPFSERLIGTAGRDVMDGLGGNDRLDGGGDADILIGGTGNDIYIVDNVADTVVELASEGTDLVQASVSYTLSDNVENLTLTGIAAIQGTGNALANRIAGNAGANILTGGAGNDILNGANGADTMIGGLGDDIFQVDNDADSVIEVAGEGTDTVQSYISVVLAANVENLTLTGTAAIDGTGNSLANTIIGNSAANRLSGGAGDDIYVIDSLDDTVVELGAEGIDQVNASITYTLAANLENLALISIGNIAGSGNELNNVLTGGRGNNTLTGYAGDDVLDGREGIDTLMGGTGNDRYLLGRGYGSDSIEENDATIGNTDVAVFDAGIAADRLWFRQASNNLEVSIIGTGDQFSLANWYLGNQYHVEQFKTSDGKTLLDSQVQNLVNAMAAFAPPAMGTTQLSAAYASQLAPVIAANWQ